MELAKDSRGDNFDLFLLMARVVKRQPAKFYAGLIILLFETYTDSVFWFPRKIWLTFSMSFCVEKLELL